MVDLDPTLFCIERPLLDLYAATVQPNIIVERYSSKAGHMKSEGRLHRISLNRTAHRRYAFRYGSDRYRLVDRPALTVGFQPAGTVLEVEGDDADYISIYQPEATYNDILGDARGFWSCGTRSLSARADATTLHAILCLSSAIGPDKPADPLMIEHFGIGFAHCVTRLFAPAYRAAVCHDLSSERLGRVVDHIENALGRQDLTLKELAAVAHLSPFHFSRAFKAATGTAPHRFVVKRRVRQAQLLLAAGRLSLAEVAYETGFSSQSHFSGTFRRLTGHTPGQYRRSVRA